MTYSTDPRRPSWRKLLAEAPAAVRLVGAQFLPVFRSRRASARKIVLVIPAYLAHDLVTLRLRRVLRSRGHVTSGWGQGVNSGARRSKLVGLLERIDRLHDRHQQKLVLVGWSLGGLYAREAAKRRPGAVEAVITLGSPISHGLRDNNVWKLYEALNDHDVDHPPVKVEPEVKPPVRTVAIWSRADGIVAPASASGQRREADEQVEVHCRHNELVSHPEALEEVVGAVER